MKKIKMAVVLAMVISWQACRQQEEPVQLGTPVFVKTKIDPTKNKHVMNMLSATVYGMSEINGRTMSSAIGDINLDEALIVNHLESGVARYTFNIEEVSSGFTNLIIRESAEGEVTGYRVRYLPELDWVIAHQGEVVMKDFTGYIAFSYLNGPDYYVVRMDAGIGHSYAFPQLEDSNGRMLGDCDGGNGTGGGTGPGSGFYDQYGGEYTWSSSEVVYLGSGTSGEIDDEVIDVIMMPPPPDLVSRKACAADGFPESSTCTHDTSSDAAYESCTSDPIGVIDGSTLADRWEQNICKKENFINNDCVHEIWNIMKSNNVGFETLQQFLGDNPRAKLCLDIKDLGDGVNGNTQPSGTINNAFMTINLNSQNLNRSKLSIARTILHEMIHAELFGMVIEAGGYDHLQQFAASYQGDDSFMMIWEYYNTYDTYKPINNPGWQHEYMADNYIQYITEGLKKLHPHLSSQGFKSLMPDFEPCGQSWSWDSYFYYMAWEGLQGTSQFQTDIVNQGKQTCFDQYRAQSDMESQSNKCN